MIWYNLEKDTVARRVELKFSAPKPARETRFAVKKRWICNNPTPRSHPIRWPRDFKTVSP
jgi:hypothetical protein